MSGIFIKSELVGKTIELINTDDPYTKLKSGDRGIIKFVFDNLGDRCMAINWESGSNLSLIEGKDDYRLID